MISKILMILASALTLNLNAQQPNAIQAPASGNGTAQAAQAGADQQPDSENDGDMEDWIDIGGKTVDRLVSLGVDRKTAESFVSDQGNDDSLWAKWQTGRAGAHERFAILFLPCHLPDDAADLYTLSRQDSAWHVTDHFEAGCRYDESVSFGIAWIRDPNRDEVLVHHDCVGSGTGLLEQQFSVFSVADGKLKGELATDEVFHSYPRAVERPRDLDQNSAFTVIPVVGSRSRAIEETRSSVLNGRLTVQRRTFRWNAAKGKYVPSAFTPVEVSPN
jgi:hypothetical protein